MKPTNIFEAIAKLGHDEDFEGQPSRMFVPTEHSPGSNEKIEVMRWRVELGLPLWHPQDNVLCTVTDKYCSKSEGIRAYRKTSPKFASFLRKKLAD